jgi:hypothetical protein
MPAKRKTKMASRISASKKTTIKSAEPDSYSLKESQSRFEKAVDVAMRTSPMHKAQPIPKRSKSASAKARKPRKTA